MPKFSNMKREFRNLLIVDGIIVLLLLFHFREIFTLMATENQFPDTFIDSELEPVVYTPTRKLLDTMGTEEIVMEPDRKLIIPKIIHQTYINLSIPMRWNKTYESIRQIHPDYNYMFWTDENSRQFIEMFYPWFLKTYDSYPYGVMRADALRYFVLLHYGGIYMDLDNGCDFRMDPLLAYPAWMRTTDPLGVSNDVMGAVPRHPFYIKVVQELERRNRNYFFPYLTIMYGTGPLLLSVLLQQYRSQGTPPPGGEVRLLAPPIHALHTTWFFSQAPGHSWHKWDAQMLLLIYNHSWIATIVIGSLLFAFVYAQYKLFQNPKNFLAFTRWLTSQAKRLAGRVSRKLQPHAQFGSRSGSSSSGSPLSRGSPTTMAHAHSRELQADKLDPKYRGAADGQYFNEKEMSEEKSYLV